MQDRFVRMSVLVLALPECLPAWIARKITGAPVSPAPHLRRAIERPLHAPQRTSLQAYE